MNETTACEVCGRAIPADGRFCPGCGRPVPSPPAFCTVCGKALTPGGLFCDKCGAPVAGAAPPGIRATQRIQASPVPENTPGCTANPASRNQGFGVLLAGLLMLVFVGSVALVLFLAGNDDAGGRVVSPSTAGKPAEDERDFSVIGEIRVPAGGGSAVLSAPGQSIDGFRIEAPAGAYPGAIPFSISTCTKTPAAADTCFKPATPVIRIEGPTQPAAKPLRVTIPVSLAPNEMALACYVDSDSSLLHPMTLLRHDRNEVTVQARHFSKIMVFKATITDLDKGGKRVDTGFKPSRHGWNFDNRGTISNRFPRDTGVGNCFGMCLGAEWAYVGTPQSRENGPSGRKSEQEKWLVSLSDNLPLDFKTPRCEYDDVRGQILVGRLQSRYQPSSLEFTTYLYELLDQTPQSDQWMAMRAGLLLTGRPLILGIFTSSNGAPHAVLAYAYTTQENRIYIYDPNNPRDDQKYIEFDPESGKFNPYVSGVTTGGARVEYTKFICSCDEDWVSWAQMNKEALEIFCDGIFPPDCLPPLEFELLEVQSDGKLGNSRAVRFQSARELQYFEVATEYVALRLKMNQSNFQSHYQVMSMPVKQSEFQPPENWIDPSDTERHLPLRKGKNIIGIAVQARPKGETDYTKNPWLWSGFQWLRVDLGSTSTGVPIDKVTRIPFSPKFWGKAGNRLSLTCSGTLEALQVPPADAAQIGTWLTVSDDNSYTGYTHSLVTLRRNYELKGRLKVGALFDKTKGLLGVSSLSPGNALQYESNETPPDGGEWLIKLTHPRCSIDYNQGKPRDDLDPRDVPLEITPKMLENGQVKVYVTFDVEGSLYKRNAPGQIELVRKEKSTSTFLLLRVLHSAW